ncbi:MAG: biliverdin-producing heme oxygenase [Pseudomonadota bacterium]
MPRDMNSFRECLREETADIHEQADREFAGLDLTERQGLSTFLMTIHAVMNHLEQVIKRDAMVEDSTISLVPTLVDDLRHDLAALGVSSTDMGWQPTNNGPLDPLAIGYVVQGSRLGTAMMAKHWATTTDPMVKQAGRYMSSRIDTRDWKALQADLADIEVGCARANKISEDVKSLFEMHMTAYASALENIEKSPAVA